MSAKATVIDYGSGNIFSISHALEHSGATIELTADPKRLAEAERLVLPGVGAFGKAMEQLRACNFIEPILRFVETGRPFLGICVGMQVMMDYGEEFGRQDGLGLVAGHVSAIPPTDADGAPHPVPHIGWNALDATEQDWQGTILDRVGPETAVYFVHSFAAVPDSQGHILATCDYGSRPVTAAITKDNMVGTQFHPEKSGPAGLRILENFIASA